MRKTQRPSKSVAKGKTQSASQSAAKRKEKNPAPRRAPGRLPVRGSRNAGLGVQPRSTPYPPAPPRSDLGEIRELAVAAMDAALDKKALLPVLIDVSAMASYTDFIGIVSGRSDRQVDAIADNICQMMRARGRHILGQEGSGSGRWTLLDFGSFVIHVFHHPVREFYDLESLWIDAPRVKLDVPPDARLEQHDALYGVL